MYPGQNNAQRPHKKADPASLAFSIEPTFDLEMALFSPHYPNLSFGLALFCDEPDVLLALTIFKLKRGLPGKVLQG